MFPSDARGFLPLGLGLPTGTPMRALTSSAVLPCMVLPPLVVAASLVDSPQESYTVQLQFGEKETHLSFMTLSVS